VYRLVVAGGPPDLWNFLIAATVVARGRIQGGYFMRMQQLPVAGLAATFLLATSSLSLAQTPTSGWVASDSGTTVSGGVVTLNSGVDSNGTSLENQNVAVQVSNGDVISFEYKGPCGGGAPRVFIQGGAYNTFDQDPNGSACGTDADGDGWFTVTQTISGITSGPAGHVGIVNDNVSNPSTVMVRNLIIDGTRIPLALRPQNADQCKNGGYVAGGFRNQGECVSSFRSNRPG